MLAVTFRGVWRTGELERLVECPEQTLGDQLGTGRKRELCGDDDELVAAEAPDRVGLAHDRVEPRGDRAQQIVAGGVAQRVVDRLEVVEIDEQRGDRRLLAAGADQHLLEAVEDQRPVRESVRPSCVAMNASSSLAARELLVAALTL